MSWFGRESEVLTLKRSGNTELESGTFTAGAGKRPYSCQDTEVGRDVQRGLVMEKTFDLDLGIWLQFRFAQTGVGRKSKVLSNIWILLLSQHTTFFPSTNSVT